ncbi:DUF418 domain-containing protein [Saccharophagus degradans]|uniref:DUF418 domain-containing protein n=1 Tax=Saccharophagus degradans TaxID=86304 RepID=UPI001C098C93|nr:DUF418 domain-containing protein [Saccharophagus degradans]MBU2987370.1 DUF418 domain-containing protein [Saccharophagus degradans]
MTEAASLAAGSTNPIKAQRLDIVDALRGFALIGVGLVHFVEQYIAGAYPEGYGEIAMATLADKIIVGLVQFFLAGKFYAIFSFLFGLSFFIQIDKPSRNNQPFAARFIWRLVLLFGFGYIHHLFYRGDILMLYSVLGISLLAMHKLPTRVLLLIALALFLGLGRYISFATTGDLLRMDMNPNSELNLFYFEQLKNGSLLDVFAINNIVGIQNLLAFQFGIFGRGYITLGLFILGMCFGRFGFFHTISQHKRTLKRSLGFAIASTVICIALMAGTFVLVGEPQFNTWLETLALTFYDLANLSLAVAICSGFILFALRENSTKTMRFFAPYGRMALTNYLMQALIGTFILYGWGLGFIGEWPNRYLLALGIAVAIFQIVFSMYWMQRFHYGPLEWVWRSLTLWQKVEFRKQL